jgi:hypothetical protein
MTAASSVKSEVASKASIAFCGTGGRGRSDRTLRQTDEGGLTPSLGVVTTARGWRIPVHVIVIRVVEIS